MWVKEGAPEEKPSPTTDRLPNGDPTDDPHESGQVRKTDERDTPPCGVKDHPAEIAQMNGGERNSEGEINGDILRDDSTVTGNEMSIPGIDLGR